MLARMARQGLETTENTNKLVDYRMDKSALTVTANGVITRIAWCEIQREIEDDNLLILCRGQATFCAFPKSQLDEGLLMALKRRGKADF